MVATTTGPGAIAIPRKPFPEIPNPEPPKSRKMNGFFKEPISNKASMRKPEVLKPRLRGRRVFRFSASAFGLELQGLKALKSET